MTQINGEPDQIHSEQITDAMAWKGGDITKEEISHWLTPANVAALEEVAERLRHQDRDEITRHQTSHPDLDMDLARIYEELIRGRGLVVIRGFPVAGPVEEVERKYWIFCTHFGELLSHNCFGDRMVRVQDEVLPGGAQAARGTKSSGELAMHNDGGDIFSLLCVHQATKGGESQFSSGPAAHNTILETRPDLLPILYRGFPHHRRSEQPHDQPDVTPYDVAIFSHIEGRVCIYFVYSSIAPALHVLYRHLSEEEEDALELLRTTLVRQQVEIKYDPGDMVMANNFAMCHSRSEYVDGGSSEKRRLLLRAWMEVPRGDRRLPVGRRFYSKENKSGRLGTDLVRGRAESISRNDYINVSEELANLFKATQKKPVVR